MIVDQGNALLQGMQVVPDLGAIDARNRQLRAQEMQLQAAMQEQQREFDRQVAWQRDVEAINRGEVGPAEARELLLRHPEQREAITAAFGNPAEEATQSNLRQAGSLLNRLEANDVPGAVRILQQRVEADRAAGREDPDDVEMLQALQSGNPQAIAAARSQLSVVIAAMDGSGEFTSSLERLNPRRTPTGIEREAEVYYNNAIASGATPEQAEQIRRDFINAKRLETVDPVQVAHPGGMVGRLSDFMNNAEGGDPASGGGGGATAPASSPEAIMGRAVQAGRMTRQDYNALVASLGPQGRAAADGWLAQNGITLEGGNAPVRVRTRQQYDALPSGTEYIAPDGSRRRKP
jgi:hypothetical protein